ncbi:MAG: sigma-54 dependent transcriptional regulator [Rhodobacteraceae bacterium]|jgi:DNA-binding NtrC family response regulator|nr:sigma-54 dependent transcriptional regulator [Paracoccaceae bacterium]
MTAAPPILLVEDTPSLQLVYAAMLRGARHQVVLAGTAAEGAAAFRSHRPRIVLLDLALPDGDGLLLMQDILRDAPDTAVIVITANGSISRAVEAMRRGAHDFVVKPFDEARLLGAVENATAALPEAAPPAAASGLPAGPALGGFIGSSPPMQAVYAKIRSVARSMATVFITGESGTGKELAAEAVHACSPRAAGPFIALNCGAIPADLLESEVFGHLRGSFTGAISDKPGAAAAADGGTLFLDEVCELDLALQTKLLRFLQTSTIQPVGATRPRKVSVRIVCATNRDPMAAVRAGQFREDLYYRLHVIPLHLPPLRERGEDVIEIASVMLTRFAAEEGKRFEGFDAEVHSLFRRYPWPGNVRELLNVLRNVAVLAEGGRVGLACLPAELFRFAAQARGTGAAAAAAAAAGEAAAAPADEPARGPGLEALIGRTLAEIEQIVIEETIARCGGSVPRAARILDVAPSTLYRKRDGWQRGTG